MVVLPSVGGAPQSRLRRAVSVCAHVQPRVGLFVTLRLGLADRWRIAGVRRVMTARSASVFWLGILLPGFMLDLHFCRRQDLCVAAALCVIDTAGLAFSLPRQFGRRPLLGAGPLRFAIAVRSPQRMAARPCAHRLSMEYFRYALTAPGPGAGLRAGRLLWLSSSRSSVRSPPCYESGQIPAPRSRCLSRSRSSARCV